jgi:MinD-like ATPase involved in chromosome partitioning or flagellar assembly
MSCGGKTGASTVAEGLAYNKSQSDLSVMYVVLSVFGKADLLEKRADSITYLEDIHSLSTDSNPERLKLINGFKEISTALSFKPSTLSELVKKAKVQEYDYIVIDTDFNYVTLIPEVLKLSNDVVLVTDGSSNSIADLEKAHEYVFNTDFQYDKKIKVIHNRYTESYRSDSLVYNEKLSTTIDELSKNFTLAEVFNAMSTINL